MAKAKNSDLVSILKEGFNKFTNDPMESSKASLSDSLSSVYSKNKFNQEEKSIADYILMKLANDVFVSVRKTLSENLKNSDILPHDVALTLAKDIEEVAAPMLEFSKILTDEDLVQIINMKHTDSTNLSIIKRPMISPPVSNAIIDTTQSSDIVKKLINHEGADIEDYGYNKIMEKFSNDEGVISSLYESPRVPKYMLEKFIDKASNVLKDKLRTIYPEYFNKYKSTIDLAVSRSWELNTLSILNHHSTDKEVFELVLQLKNNSRLNASIILMSLCVGYLKFFQMSLAALTKGNYKNIVESLNQDINNLGEIYDKSGLPQSFKEAVIVLYNIILDINKDENNLNLSITEYMNLVLRKIIRATKNKEIEGMDYIINIIKRSVGGR